jgi:hypothetical protein
MYSGKIAVPPGGGGIRKIVTNQYDLFDNKFAPSAVGNSLETLITKITLKNQI